MRYSGSCGKEETISSVFLILLEIPTLFGQGERSGMARKYKKVPVILQMEALECGAASLGMVLAYYGRYIPLEQLRADCSVSRDGSRAGNILAAARFHGMEAKGFRCSVGQVRKMPVFPIIIHWNFNHFVVLDGFRGEKAVINDPAGGIIEVSMEEFEQSFTGIALTMEPGEDFVRCGKKKNVWDYLGSYIQKYKNIMLLILLSGFLTAVLGITTPIFSRIFMDYVLLGSAAEWMPYLTGGMLAVAAVLFFTKVIRSILMFRAKQAVGMQMNARFMWHALHLPVEFFGQRSPGDISGRQADNETVAELLFQKVAPALLDVVMAVLYFAVLAMLNLPMALVALAAVILQFALMRGMSGKNQTESRKISRDEGKYAGAAMSGISMIETIKASGSEEGYFQKITGYLAKYNNSNVMLRTRMLVIEFLPELLSQLCDAFLLIMGIYYILDGQITIGLLLAFQGFFGQFLAPAGAVLEMGSDMQQAVSKLERINDVLDYPADVPEEMGWDSGKTSDRENRLRHERLEGRLEFRDVCFAYGRLSPLFIENFNLVIEPGQTVALVGGSGSGKSTLASLVTGLYPPRSGEILFDGRTRSETDRYIFTQSVGIVNQTISLFNDTVRNNLTLWDDSVEESAIVEACRLAEVFDDIMRHPEGLDYMLAEGGRNLSGGQRQRLEIARALIKMPSILILDEATSALDPVTEKKVMDALKKRKITSIFIAHRLSTVRHADRIIMLDHGHVAEAGTHESLMKDNGAYASLVRSE